MQKCPGIIVLLLVCFNGMSGCVSFWFEKPALPAIPSPAATLSPVATQAAESPAATVALSDMALRLSDIPEDYILRDRSVMVSPQVNQLARDLGWQQGYYVSFYRMNRDKDDLTGICQYISRYPLENINKVFSLEKQDMASRADSGISIYELPFPVTGDFSIAFRETSGDPDALAVYTVLFVRKNVFEKITMGGTTTDYEVLKEIAGKAATKVR